MSEKVQAPVQDNKNAAASPQQMVESSAGELSYADFSADVLSLKSIQGTADTSRRVNRITQLQARADASNSIGRIYQLQTIANPSSTANKMAQLEAMNNKKSVTQLAQKRPLQRKANKTGLPDNLKTGIESLSGVSMDSVNVHKNSEKPAQLNAHAYAQGNDIHLGSGQEKHLPHEAWHVVQQSQGRVKPTSQMAGVNINDNKGLEKDADVMGVKAAKLGHQYSPNQLVTTNQNSKLVESSLAMGRAVQLAGVDLDMVKTGADVTWDYIYGLLAQRSVEDAAIAVVKVLCTWVTDNLTSLIVPTSIQEYLDLIAPWISKANAVVSIVEKIPEDVRTSILYVVGFGIRKLSTSLLSGRITESHIHDLLTGSQDFADKLRNIIHFLNNLVVSPTGALYSLYNSGLFGGVSSYLFGGGGESKQDARHEEEVSAESSKSERQETPMIDMNTNFFWLNAQAPKLANWKDRKSDKERAGMEMNARMGFKIFDNVVGTDNLKFRLPYGGDWETTMTDVSIVTGDIGIDSLLTISGVRASKVRFNQEGLKFLHIIVDKVVLGDEVVSATNTTLTWGGDKNEITLRGNAEINLLSKKFNTNLSLTMDKKGEFKSGKLDLTLIDKIDMVSGRMQIFNPEFSGFFEKGKTPDIAAKGDVKLKLLDQLNLASEAVRIAYVNGGFEGSVNLLTLTLNISDDTKVIFKITGGKIDKTGFSAELVKLTYAYEPTALPSDTNSDIIPNEGENTIGKSDIPGLLPGFNMDWVKNAGLETLVVSGSAASVRLGNAGLEVGDVTRSLDKFSGKMFGVSAEFDGENKRGVIKGSSSIEPSMPSLDIVFPVLPGLEVGLGVGTSIKLTAGLEGSLTKKDKEDTNNFTPWEVGGNASLDGEATIEAHVGAHAGSQFLLSVGAELFAEISQLLRAKATLSGTVLNNNDSYELKTSDKENEKLKANYTLETGLNAKLGGRIRAKAFYFFEKKLYEYRFKKWELGNWVTEGTIFSKADGSNHIEQGDVTFDGKSTPNFPIIDKSEMTVFETIERLDQQGDKINDTLLLRRLVYDIAEIGLKIENDKRLELYNKILGFAENPSAVEVDALEKLRYMNQRSASGMEPSLIMLKDEWVKYSTTKSLFSENKRRSVVPIDDAIDAYHQTESKSGRINSLKILQSKVDEYIKESNDNSRIDMVKRLENDIKNEEIILQELSAESESTSE
jgi:hypothetical protein